MDIKDIMVNIIENCNEEGIKWLANTYQKLISTYCPSNIGLFADKHCPVNTHKVENCETCWYLAIIKTLIEKQKFDVLYEQTIKEYKNEKN